MHMQHFADRVKLQNSIFQTQAFSALLSQLRFFTHTKKYFLANMFNPFTIIQSTFISF